MKESWRAESEETGEMEWGGGARSEGGGGRSTEQQERKSRVTPERWRRISRTRGFEIS